MPKVNKQVKKTAGDDDVKEKEGGEAGEEETKEEDADGLDPDLLDDFMGDTDTFDDSDEL